MFHTTAMLSAAHDFAHRDGARLNLGKESIGEVK